MRYLITTLILLMLINCAPESGSQTHQSTTPAEIEILAEWMTGSFSSAQQAESDSDYYDIRLEMVPIWLERTDGPWLYVEQAVAGYEDQPYRVRIYHLEELPGDTLVSRVFALPGVTRFYGGCQDPSRLDVIHPDSLLERGGCGVYLIRSSAEEFSGSTLGNGCSSSRGGASYTTAEVRVQPDQLSSWDRGFDSSGTQVWGAEKGGYIFNRIQHR